MHRTLFGLLSLATMLPARIEAAPLTPAEAAFEKHVRPVLVEQCQNCHGPRKQMGGLRLDSRAAMLKGGDTGPAVRPGDPEGSLLLQAVRHQGDLKMPPRKRLPDEVVGLLAAWIKAGASWPAPIRADADTDAWKRHWAFQQVRRPAIPTVRDAGWARTPIDRFVLARLEAAGLSPSPGADRRTLIRRLSFDLIGLPPSPEEVEAFVADTRPGAYERVVDHLLASPRYGERWGRYWLDVARYADTKGYVFFEESNLPWGWTYRDWVIEAINADLPHDRFVMEQIAADQIPGASRRSLRALGFLTLGGRFMNNPHDILDDRIDVVTRGLMGLTVSCARCHDHKFDPIPSADYYALYGVFASCTEPTIPPLYEEPPATPQYQKFVAEMSKREKALTDFLDGKFAAVREGARRRLAEYLLAAHARRGQPRADDFMLLADPNDLNPSVISRYQAYLDRTARSHHRVWAVWNALADLPEKEFADRARGVCARAATGKLADQPIHPWIARAFTRPVTSRKDAAERYAALLAKVDQPTRSDDPLAEELRQELYGRGAPANIPRGLFSELELLPDRAAQGQLKKLRTVVEQWRATGPGAPPRANVLLDRAVPHQPVVFRRGNPSNPGNRVPRRFLTALSGPDAQPFQQGSGRLELARAITDPKNPLTGRVLVNRAWMHLFGRGLVETPSDFGMRAAPPSHPELLDWLTEECRSSGWSVKRLHRLIVTSAAYRQASVNRPPCRAVDPENVLLWRMNRRHLDLEALRDALLVSGGQLDARIGGPSVRDALNPGVRRRTLYSYVDRLNVPGLFRTFDFPGPDASSPKRDRTLVPQQALFLLNSPFVLGVARSLAARAVAPDATDRIRLMYQIAYGRIPDAGELRLARAFTATNRPIDWQRLAQALLVSNEFVYLD